MSVKYTSQLTITLTHVDYIGRHRSDNYTIDNRGIHTRQCLQLQNTYTFKS